MKIYIGTRGPDGCSVSVQDGAEIRMLDSRLDLRNHSPTGFEWGYTGSGPAQLALAILADCLGNDRDALRLYQTFKFSVIAALPRHEDAPWRMTAADVRKWCRANWQGMTASSATRD